MDTDVQAQLEDHVIARRQRFFGPLLHCCDVSRCEEKHAKVAVSNRLSYVVEDGRAPCAERGSPASNGEASRTLPVEHVLERIRDLAPLLRGGDKQTDRGHDA